jgi:hypothetical protein
MIQPDNFQRVREALDKLVERYIHHPGVSLIDMGFDPDPAGGEQVVLRVHVRGSNTEDALDLPQEVDGIPVRRVSGDYRPEG